MNLILSSQTLSFHWIKPPEQVLEGIYKALNKGGRFAAEFGGKGNVQMIVNAALEMFRKEGIKNQADRIPWYFPSIGEYALMMEKVGFRVTRRSILIGPHLY